MISGYYITILIFIISIHSVLSQDCIFPGKICNSDASCCGGCCINNKCINTYRSCFVHDDLCLDHSCPSDEECYIFQPNCAGCEAYADCKKSKRKNGKSNITAGDNIERNSNSGSQLFLFNKFLTFLPLLLFVSWCTMFEDFWDMY